MQLHTTFWPMLLLFPPLSPKYWRLRAGTGIVIFAMMSSLCLAQDAHLAPIALPDAPSRAVTAANPDSATDASATKAPPAAVSSTSGQQLPVNWLYGAYIPTEAPMAALTDADRWHLYVRQGFTTSGIWIKTGLFTMSDQVKDSPPGWPQDPQGFGYRVGTRYAQFLMQNSFTAIGDAMGGLEPRYDLCRNCTSVGQRIKHAIVRNFVTYGSDEKSMRPQVALYAGSFGGAALAALWQPYSPNPVVKGYQGMATQAWVGVLCNLLAEFAPDFKRAIHKDKKTAADSRSSPPELEASVR